MARINKGYAKSNSESINRTIQEHMAVYALTEYAYSYFGFDVRDIKQRHYEYIQGLSERRGDLLRYVIALRREMNTNDGWRKAREGDEFYVRLAECEAYAENRRKWLAAKRRDRRQGRVASSNSIRPRSK